MRFADSLPKFCAARHGSPTGIECTGDSVGIDPVGYSLGANLVAGYTEAAIRLAGAVLILAGVGQLYVAGV